MTRVSMRSAVATAVLLMMAPIFVMWASAQARPTATGPGSFVSVGGGASLFQSVYGERNLGGGFVFADVQPHWRFGIEAEARFLHLHSSEQVSEKSFLVGPRVLVRSHTWQPYAKFLIGDGHINLPFGYGRGDFLALAPGAGLDLALNEAINVRVVDFEYQLWRDFPYGPMHPYGISAGISFRLTPLVRFPKGPRLQSRTRTP